MGEYTPKSIQVYSISTIVEKNRQLTQLYAFDVVSPRGTPASSQDTNREDGREQLESSWKTAACQLQALIALISRLTDPGTDFSILVNVAMIPSESR